MQKTENYNLCQWDATDPIRREDFNADNAAIEEALGEKSRVVIGSYTLTAAQLGQVCEISLGFHPKAVLISRNEAENNASRVYQNSALLLDGYPIKISETQTIAQITENGFSVQRHIYSGTAEPYYPRVAETMTYIYIVFS